MKQLKRVLGACAFVVMASALGGCVIVPVPWGGGGGGHHDHYHYRG